MRSQFACAVVCVLGLHAVLALSAPCTAREHSGVHIEPTDGVFEFVDDFSTQRFVDQAFLANLGVEQWIEGAITSCGPNRNRTATWRFYGDRVIASAAVEVRHRANARSLGGVNQLWLSANGLDWRLAATSREQEGDVHNWQTQPLVATDELLGELTGRGELWVRVVMDNHSGLKTSTSNFIQCLTVRLGVGDTLQVAGDPHHDALRRQWEQSVSRAGQGTISLELTSAGEAPCYYEDAEGRLLHPGQDRRLIEPEDPGFSIRRDYSADGRYPLALVAFVRNAGRGAMVRLTTRATDDASRNARILWDGVPLVEFDAARAFDDDVTTYTELPAGHDALHELRVDTTDSKPLTLTELNVTGLRSLAWGEKPELPQGRLELLSAAYLPDPPPPPASQAVEGRQTQDVGLVFAGLQRFYGQHEQFGGLRVCVRNSSRVPVAIRSIRLNRRPVEHSYVDFTRDAWDAPGVVWYRVRPRLVKPGACAEVYIRFRRRPPGDVADVRIVAENAPSLSATIPYLSPPLTIDYVVTDEQTQTLYAYASPRGGTDSRITAAMLDGVGLQRAEIYGADMASGVCLVVAGLAEPLKQGSYHVLGLRTQSGETISAQFRVRPFLFPRTSIHTPLEQLTDMHMNLRMWHQAPLDACLAQDVYTTSTGIFGTHERTRYVMGPDEPDAHDNVGGGYDRGLGHWARRLQDAGWQPLIERFAPQASSWIIMNGTTRPLNWCVYGQLADIACFDPYPINFYGADHTLVRESLDYARRCGAPGPMYACLEAFGWQEGQGVPGNRRGPLPEEYRQNVVQAVGCGMKGLTSWTYAVAGGGWQSNNDAARAEIAASNAMLAAIEGPLLLGHPTEWASTDAGDVMTGVVGNEQWPKERVWARALLCGPDTIVLAVANHIPASKPEPPTIEPAVDVSVSVRVPPWMTPSELMEVTQDGLTPHPAQIDECHALVRLAELRSGRLFILRR
jgi:hypothetical protein